MQVPELLSAFLTGLITTAEVRRRRGHHSQDGNSVAQEVCAPGKLLPKLLGAVGFQGTFARAGGIPSLQPPTSQRGMVPRGHGLAWAPGTGLRAGGAGGVGERRSRRGSRPGDPEVGAGFKLHIAVPVGRPR